MARLPDGSWSAPSLVTPQNFAIGLVLGVDIFDVVLLINSNDAMEGFKSHKFTMGADTAVVAGPMGVGTSAETSLKSTKLVPPIFSYVKSRGLYAGVEVMGQAFLTRFDENERVYHYPGIAGKDILEGKVRIPAAVGPLHRALREAETGKAQTGAVLPKALVTSPHLAQLSPTFSQTAKMKRNIRRVPPPLVDGRTFEDAHEPLTESAPAASESFVNGNGSQASSSRASLDSLPPSPQPVSQDLEAEQEDETEEEVDPELELREDERLHLPPTPEQLSFMEGAGYKDEDDIEWERKEKEAIWALPKPPQHPDVRKYYERRAAASPKTAPAEMQTFDTEKGKMGLGETTPRQSLDEDQNAMQPSASAATIIEKNEERGAMVSSASAATILEKEKALPAVGKRELPAVEEPAKEEVQPIEEPMEELKAEESSEETHVLDESRRPSYASHTSGFTDDSSSTADGYQSAPSRRASAADVNSPAIVQGKTDHFVKEAAIEEEPFAESAEAEMDDVTKTETSDKHVGIDGCASEEQAEHLEGGKMAGTEEAATNGTEQESTLVLPELHTKDAADVTEKPAPFALQPSPEIRIGEDPPSPTDVTTEGSSAPASESCETSSSEAGATRSFPTAIKTGTDMGRSDSARSNASADSLSLSPGAPGTTPPNRPSRAARPPRSSARPISMLSPTSPTS